MGLPRHLWLHKLFWNCHQHTFQTHIFCFIFSNTFISSYSQAHFFQHIFKHIFHHIFKHIFFLHILKHIFSSYFQTHFFFIFPMPLNWKSRLIITYWLANCFEPGNNFGTKKILIKSENINLPNSSFFCAGERWLHWDNISLKWFSTEKSWSRFINWTFHFWFGIRI